MTLSIFLAGISEMAKSDKICTSEIEKIYLHLDGPVKMKIPVSRGDVDFWGKTKTKLKGKMLAAHKRNQLKI